jgi:hypothetical protein
MAKDLADLNQRCVLAKHFGGEGMAQQMSPL